MFLHRRYSNSYFYPKFHNNHILNKGSNTSLPVIYNQANINTKNTEDTENIKNSENSENIPKKDYRSPGSSQNTFFSNFTNKLFSNLETDDLILLGILCLLYNNEKKDFLLIIVLLLIFFDI